MDDFVPFSIWCTSESIKPVHAIIQTIAIFFTKALFAPISHGRNGIFGNSVGAMVTEILRVD